MIAEQTDDENARGVEWRKENGALTYKVISVQERSFNPRMYYLPVPLSEINKTGMQQNPGY
jgi:hypothetical protein